MRGYYTNDEMFAGMLLTAIALITIVSAILIIWEIIIDLLENRDIRKITEKFWFLLTGVNR
jgi:hypothetical protein